jgi:hypothetical protein
VLNRVRQPGGVTGVLQGLHAVPPGPSVPTPDCLFYALKNVHLPLFAPVITEVRRLAPSGRIASLPAGAAWTAEDYVRYASAQVWEQRLAAPWCVGDGWVTTCVAPLPSAEVSDALTRIQRVLGDVARDAAQAATSSETCRGARPRKCRRWPRACTPRSNACSPSASPNAPCTRS